MYRASVGPGIRRRRSSAGIPFFALAVASAKKYFQNWRFLDYRCVITCMGKTFPEDPDLLRLFVWGEFRDFFVNFKG